MVLGLSDFTSLRQNGTYVDKTDIVDEIAPYIQSSSCLIVNRPRRFGKSLMVSMLEAFFSSDLDSKSLFDGLKISKSPNYALLNSFPVVKISFKNVSSMEPAAIKDALKSAIASVCAAWLKRLKGRLPEGELAELSQAVSGQADDFRFASSINVLCTLIHKSYGKKAIVLVDEYDAPIEASFGTDAYEGVLAFLKSFYLGSFKDTSSFGYAFITGVFGIAKGTLGTGLNNIPVDSGASSPLSKNYFGFDQGEIDLLCAQFNIPEKDKEALQKYYGGYSFLGGTFYNPWSVLSFIAMRTYASYWGNTGSNKAFSKAIDEAYRIDADLVSSLLRGSIETRLDFTAGYEDIGANEENVLLYLILAGYLAFRQVGFETYRVYLPNEESRSAFLNEIVQRYKDKSAIRKVAMLKDALEKGDEEKIASFFAEFLLSSLSYYDFADEKNYQIMAGTIAALLFNECIVKHEVIAGEGRCDIMISPLNEKSFGAVIEFKCLTTRVSATRLAEKAQTALNQIEKKQYLQELIDRNAQPIVAYGFAFHKKSIAVKKKRIR